MTTNHIAQLTQWWETAEKGGFLKGDTIITKDDDGYFVGAASMSDPDPYDSVRVLARAPKPKPAWHDAAAVTATATDDLGDEITAVWVREGDELWRSDEGGMVLRDDLRDVTPLIEAKVPDEMTDRAWAASKRWEFGGISKPAARAILAAALGIEAE